MITSEVDDADVVYFMCGGCKARRTLIRGRCADCAPEWHADHGENMRRYLEAERRFIAETGAESALSDWDGFNAFCARKGLGCV